MMIFYLLSPFESILKIVNRFIFLALKIMHTERRVRFKRRALLNWDTIAVIEDLALSNLEFEPWNITLPNPPLLISRIDTLFLDFWQIAQNWQENSFQQQLRI